MLFTLQHFYQTTQNNLHFTYRNAHNCIALKSIMFLCHKKELFHKYQQYTSLYYFALTLFPTNSFFKHTYNKLVFQGSLIHIDPAFI